MEISVLFLFQLFVNTKSWIWGGGQQFVMNCSATYKAYDSHKPASDIELAFPYVPGFFFTHLKPACGARVGDRLRESPSISASGQPPPLTVISAAINSCRKQTGML